MKKVLALIMCMLLAFSAFAACTAPSLNDFIEAARPEVEKMDAALGDSMSIELSSKGENTVVYVFRYNVELDVSNEEAAPALLESLEESNDTYTGIVKSLADLGIKDPVVLIEYYDVDGNLITNKEYK